MARLADGNMLKTHRRLRGERVACVTGVGECEAPGAVCFALGDVQYMPSSISKVAPTLTTVVLLLALLLIELAEILKIRLDVRGSEREAAIYSRANRSPSRWASNQFALRSFFVFPGLLCVSKVMPTSNHEGLAGFAKITTLVVRLRYCYYYLNRRTGIDSK